MRSSHVLISLFRYFITSALKKIGAGLTGPSSRSDAVHHTALCFNSTPCRRAPGSSFADRARLRNHRLVRRPHRNLPVLLFELRHGDHYFQNAVAEVRLSFLDLRALLQRDQPVEAPVYPFRVAPPAFLRRVLAPALAVNYQALI